MQKSRGHSPLLRAICASLLCSVAAGAAWAESLGDLRGVWARSAADCKTYLSGQFANMDHASRGQIGLIGFCNDGMDLVYDVVNCRAADIRQQSHSVTFAATCRVKDYTPDKLRISLAINGELITFNEKDFEGANFSFNGDYVRCTRDYRCER